MEWRMIRTLVIKDVTLFFKDRFFAFITVLALVAYAVVYFLMPSSVEETMELGLVASGIPADFFRQMEVEGLVVREMETEAALREAISGGDLPAGVVFPDDMAQQAASGEKPRVDLYVASDTPGEIRELYAILLRELTFTMSGRPLRLEVSEETLGPDMAGQQIATRDRMLPLFAVFLLMMETLGLASLITAEITGGTLRALLVTPLTVEGLFLGKGITGVGLAFGEASLLMAVTGGLAQRPLLILVALFLGSLLVTGIAFLMASASKDMMSVMSWGVLALLLLAIPAFGVLLPGVVSEWVRVIPSYYLVDTVHRASNFGAGWADLAGNLLALLLFSAAFMGLGIVVLRRKFT